MKQTKKLLSIFLSVLMLIGMVSVVGNAAIAKTDVHYDSMDNAALTPEQVANIILDSLDRDVMPGLGVIDEDLAVIKIQLDLTSVDTALRDIYNLLNGKLPGIAGGDVQTIANEKGRLQVNGHTVQRSDGDLKVLYCLLDFLMNDTTAGILSKAPYGLLQSGGIEAGGLVDTVQVFYDIKGLVQPVNDILMDIDGLVAGLVYDLLLYGSYGNDLDAEGLKAAGKSVPTPDATIATAITTLLTKPQKYTYNADGTKAWDMDSVILSADKLEGKDLSLKNNSILSIVDQCLQTAYTSFGKQVLNHDLKKIFMEAMGVDFVTLDAKKDADEIAKIKADPAFVNVEDGNPTNAGDVKNYFVNAQMWKVDNVWYFRDYVTRPVLDANGNMQYTTDDEGNQVVVTALQHRYQRAEAYNANDLYGIFNWDYKFTDSTLNFDQLIPQYGSIIGCLNHILHVALEMAVNPAALGVSSIDVLWADGGNDNFNENLMTTAKFLLKNFTFEFFGRNPLYVDLNTLKANAAFIQKVDSFGNDAAGREGIIAYMLLPFLGDALPQLVYDLDMFTPGVQIEQTAALLVREFLSDLTPQINYDDQIFVDASLASGRKFKTYTSAQWMELILNMGLDLAAVYLDNISSFNVDLNTLAQIKKFAVDAGAPAYMGVLEEIVDWAIDYISDGQDFSVILGLEPKTISSVRCVTSYNDKNDTVTVVNNYAGNAFDIVSTALNKLLPLGMLVGCSTDKYALDVQVVFNKLIDVIDDLDLEVLLGVFGRTGRSDSLLEAKNIPVVILNLVNRILNCLFGKTILVANPDVAEPINNALQQASLKTTIYNLLTGLNSRKEAIVRSALPLVALFISDFGGEQTFKVPGVDVDTVVAETGERTLSIKNKSYGIWRGYMQGGERKQDEHYNLIVEKVAAYNIDGSASSYVSVTDQGTGTFAYGASSTVKYTVNSIPTNGAFVRFDVTYKITGSDGKTPLTTESSTVSSYMWLRPAGDDLGHDPDKTYSGSGGDWDVTVYGGTHVYDVSAYTEEEITALINSFNGKVAYYVHRDKGGTFALKTTGGVDVSGAQEQNGWRLSQIYKEKTKDEVNVTATYDITNMETFSNAVRNGGYFEWRYDGYANQASSTEFKNEPAIWLFYNRADLDMLRELVNQELEMRRTSRDYNTSASQWTTYVSALQNAAKAAYQPINGSMVFNFKQLYEALDAAVENVENAKLTTASDVSGYIATLKNTVKSVNTQLGGASFRTYALYRWYDLNDLRNDAYNMINLYERAQATAPDTKFFPYSDISEFDLNKLVSNDQYKGYILALLEDMTEEDAARAKEDYRNAKKDLSNLQTSTIADTNDLLGKSVGKLLPREGGVVNTYLIKEINSAKAVIGTTNNKGYSERSWNAYSTALAKAEAVKDSTSQDTIFDAKYQLQVARNNLIPTTQEADYEELLALIKQAETVMNNTGLYNNTDAEFGAVLAALGYEVTDADGNTVQLFPGSAKTIENVSFDKHDQDEIDDVADDLKKALSKMVFKGASYGGATVESSQVPTGEVDENDVAIKETVKTTVIDAKQLIDAVTAKFAGTTANGATDAEIRVSLDDSYTLATGNEKFVGTGATITIYTTQAGVKVPLSTIKVVVKGDVTGDGVIDVLDCMLVELVGTDKTTVSGVYSLAGDIANDGKVGLEDLGAVANLAKQTH